jgi:hypothetical protein
LTGSNSDYGKVHFAVDQSVLLASLFAFSQVVNGIFVEILSLLEIINILFGKLNI